MSEPRVSNWSLAGRVYFTACENDGRTFRVGFVVTAHGVVGLYDQGRGAGGRPYTSMSFSGSGRHMSASWDRTFSDRYLKTLATRFAADCLEQIQ